MTPIKYFMRLIITSIAILLATKGTACGCEMYNVEFYLNKVEFIFTGKIVEILDSSESLVYYDKNHNKIAGFKARVLVLKKIKSGQIISDTLEFTSQGSSCDPKYKLGESYLFFAEKNFGQTYQMRHCTPWGTLRKSKKNITKLQKAIKNFS